MGKAYSEVLEADLRVSVTTLLLQYGQSTWVGCSCSLIKGVTRTGEISVPGYCGGRYSILRPIYQFSLLGGYGKTGQGTYGGPC